jgi:hypothetical protein
MICCLRLHLAARFFRGQFPDKTPLVPNLDGFPMQSLCCFAERVFVVETLNHLRRLPDVAVRIYDVETDEKHAAPKKGANDDSAP